MVDEYIYYVLIQQIASYDITKCDPHGAEDELGREMVLLPILWRPLCACILSFSKVPEQC